VAYKSGERRAVPLPTGSVNVWAILSDALAGVNERPANSVTAEEVAARKGISYSHAGNVLRANKALRAVNYRRNGKSAVCFVPRGSIRVDETEEWDVRTTRVYPVAAR
jgi:hypothetical protein